jgi:hypothetical protein
MDEGEADGIDRRGGKDGEGDAILAGDVIFTAAGSIWHDTMDLPITATDRSALLMMRASSSSLLPG